MNIKRTFERGPWTLVLSGVLIAGAMVSCTTANTTSSTTNELSAAGFVVRLADTPQRKMMLAQLPARQLIQRSRGKSISYVYADPAGCSCLFIGNEKAYRTYQKLSFQKQIADRQLATARAYEGVNWDWSAWGPYYEGFY